MEALKNIKSLSLPLSKQKVFGFNNQGVFDRDVIFRLSLYLGGCCDARKTYRRFETNQKEIQIIPWKES